MVVTELEMVMEVREVQPENALFPMLVTDSGMVMEVRPEQPENALFPILVTDSGIVMEVRRTISLHKLAGMDSTPSPNVKDMILVLLDSPRFPIQFLAFHVIVRKLEHPANAPFPMFVINSGIMMEDRLEQPWNA